MTSELANLEEILYILFRRFGAADRGACVTQGKPFRHRLCFGIDVFPSFDAFSAKEGLLDQGSSSKWKEFNSSLLNYVAGALVLLNSLKLGLEKGHGLLDWMLLA